MGDVQPKHLATVDVWDTLLRRRCHPDAVKLHVARRLLLRRSSTIQAPFGDTRSLLGLRLEVERDLARLSRRDSQCDDEYAHIDVLREWLARACPAPGADDASLLAELAAAETAHEAFVSYLDERAVQTLRAWRVQCRRLLFLSDFYMASDAVAALIESKSPGVVLDGGLTSSDQKVNKRSGRLFERVQLIEGVTPAQHRHLGDNRVSDLQVPRGLGIEAHRHHDREQERLRRRRAAEFASPPRQIWRLDRECMRRAAGQGPARALHEFAAMAAPLFAGFAAFITERAHRDRVEAIYFLTREGEFFRHVLDAWARVYPALASSLPPLRVLEVSRLATFGPSLAFEQEGGLEAGLQRLWKGFPDQSFIALAASLGVDATSARAAIEQHGLDPDAPVRGIANSETARRLLRDENFRGLLTDRLRNQRPHLLHYLAQSGIADCKRVGIVDIGWRGSMQDHLSALLPDQQSFGYYLGLQPSLGDPSTRVHRDAYSAAGDRPGLRLFSHLPTLELLCMSGQGSVTEYASAAGAATAVRATLLANQQRWHHEIAQPWQTAVIQHVAHWAHGMHDQSLGGEDLLDLALRRWSRMVNRPPGWLRRELAVVEHDERFGRGRVGAMPSPRRGWKRFLPP